MDTFEQRRLQKKLKNMQSLLEEKRGNLNVAAEEEFKKKQTIAELALSEEYVEFNSTCNEYEQLLDVLTKIAQEEETKKD